MTTEEGNKIIAEFMNLELAEYDQFIGTDQITFKPESLKYNSSWERLMQVVEKIENGDYDFEIHKSTCKIWYCNSCHEIKRQLGESKIKAVWLAVVEFINWYNNNNK